MSVRFEVPASLRQALDDRGLNPDDLLASIPRSDNDVGFLTGSHSVGEASPTSDVDILLVSADPFKWSPPSESTNHPSIYGNSYDFRLNGLPINLECVHERYVNLIANLVADVAQAVESGATFVPAMPNLQPLEVRLLQRVMTGIQLFGEVGRVESWRAHISIPALTQSYAALNFVMSMSFLEDAHVSQQPRIERDTFSRAGAEAMLLAALNYFGQPTYDIKHIWRRTNALRSKVDPLPLILKRTETALFPPAQDGDAHHEILLEYARDLAGHFSAADSSSSIVLALLRPFASEWQWADVSI